MGSTQYAAPVPLFFLSKSDLAYEEIKRRIVTDELTPGAVISQERVAAELGSSTSPLREALKRLSSEGLVTLGAYRDARVTELSVEEARGLFEVRLCLDPYAAGLAAERRTEDDIAAVREALAALQPIAAQPELASLTAHRRFHRALYSASHNPTLIDILDGLWDRADRYRLVGLRARTQPADHVARVRAEHAELADAVAAGDAETARKVMHEHVNGSLMRGVIDSLAGDA